MKRQSDRLMMVGAQLGWVGVGVFGVWQIAEQDSGDGWGAYMLFAVSLLIAVGFSTALAWKTTRSAPRRTLHRAGAGVGMLAVAASVVAWAVPLWATLVAITFALFAAAALPSVRPVMAVLAAAQLVGMAAMFGAITAEVGRQDSYGDYPAAFGIGQVTIAAGSLLGLAMLARLGAVTARPAATAVNPDAPVTV